jgi:hypothetical protein
MVGTGGKRPGAGRKPKRHDKAKYDMMEMAKGYAPEALEVFAKIMRSGESEAAKVAAADKLLDRGYGKAPQALEHTGAGGGDIKHDIRIVIVDPKAR